MANRETSPHPSSTHTCKECNRASDPSEGSAESSHLRPSYVYAIGRIEARTPTLGVEKEFAQATGRAETANLTDRQALHAVLAERQNRYLARQLCYVLTIQGLETYIIRPRDPDDLELLIDSLGGTPNPSDLVVVIGLRGPLAPPTLCNGLILPLVTFEQIYTFDAPSLVRAMPKPERTEEGLFRSTTEELFARVVQITDNAGASDEHRALNYLAVRYPSIYAKTAEAHASGSSLSSIESRPSRLSGPRTIVDVILTFTDRRTDVDEKFFVRVDVTEEFPFLVTKLSPFFDR